MTPYAASLYGWNLMIVDIKFNLYWINFYDFSVLYLNEIEIKYIWWMKLMIK